MDLETARRLAVENELEGPDWALDLDTPIDQIRALIGSDGGCGPGKWGDRLFPDWNFGLNMKPVCYLHDCDYHDAETNDQRMEADIRIYANGVRYIHARTKYRIVRWVRLRWWGRVHRAVDLGGGGFID